jgi:hypothetical protein
VDADTGVLYSSTTGAGLLQMAIDHKGRLYGRVDAIDDFEEGKVVLAGDGFNLSIGIVLRVLRLKHEFGLRILKDDHRNMVDTLNQYKAKEVPLPGFVIETAQKQVDKIMETAIDPEQAQRELESLGIIEILEKGRLNAAETTTEEIVNQLAEAREATKNEPIEFEDWIPEEEDLLEPVKLFIERLMIETVKIKRTNRALEQAGKPKQIKIVAIQTGWIPDTQLQYIQSLLNSLSHMYQRKGMEDIVFVRRRFGNDLATAINDAVLKAQKKGYEVPTSNIVIIGESEVVHAPKFDPFREALALEDRAFFGEIVLPPDLLDNTDIKLTKIISQAMDMAFGSSNRRTCQFYPQATPIEYEDLEKIYKQRQEFLKSA